MADTTTTPTETPAVAPVAPAAPIATTAPAAPAYADAVLVPSSYMSKATGSRSFHRIKAILDIAEPLMGVDRSKGEKAYLRTLSLRANDGADGGAGSWYCFVTSEPDNVTYLYGNGSPNQGMPRYTWTPTAADPLVQTGVLIDKS